MIQFIIAWQLIAIVVSQQSPSSRPQFSFRSFQCHCMEYWQCIEAGGSPYAYCQYSGTKVCCFIDSGPRSIGILPKPVKVDNCGRKGIDTGREGIAEPAEWPWHAAILEKPQDIYVCGGALVDEYWVLTAAHCVDDYSTVRALKIRLGEHDVTTTNEPYRHEEFDVSRVVIHPAFNNATLVNDIALVQLSRAARRKPNINTVCMPDLGVTDRDMLPSTKCYVTGWGKKTESSIHSTVLKEINVPLWRRNDCERTLRKHFGPGFRLSPTTVCAGAEGRDACDGDGGGPLVCEKNRHWYQVGIVSFGIGCGRPDAPGVYTKVEEYKDWIHEVVLNA